MKLLIVAVVVTLAVLSSICVTADKFEFREVKLPHLKESQLEIEQAQVEFFDSIQGKRVIWVVGEFKVGKTFIIDLLTKAEVPKSSPIANTLGLNIYIGEKLVIIDSEGMNQPAGTNNPYFVKEFIMNLMELTADEVVLVSDQMKLTDIEAYRRIANMYYNTRMTNFVYVHNCKRLSMEQLNIYQDRVRGLLDLDDSFTDSKISVKPIDHLFYPTIPLAPGDGDNVAFAILKSAGRTLHGYLTNMFGPSSEALSDLSIITTANKHAKRGTFNAKSYAQAIDQSLRYMGIELQVNFTNNGKFTLQDHRNYIVEYSPPWIVYCMADSTTLVMKLRTGEFLSFARIENGRALSLQYMSYTPDYKRFSKQHRIMLPLPSLEDDQSTQPWRAFRHPDGITTFMIPVAEGQGGDLGIAVCKRGEAYGSEFTANSAHELPLSEYGAAVLQLIELWKTAARM